MAIARQFRYKRTNLVWRDFDCDDKVPLTICQRELSGQKEKEKEEEKGDGGLPDWMDMDSVVNVEETMRKAEEETPGGLDAVLKEAKEAANTLKKEFHVGSMEKGKKEGEEASDAAGRGPGAEVRNNDGGNSVPKMG